MGSGKLAYIMSRFPNLSETFILREMIEMEKLGWDIAVYPLILQQQDVVHSAALSFLERANNLPFISASLIKTNIFTFIKHPLLFLSLLAQVGWANRTSLKFLVRALAIFPKSVQMATLMQSEGVQHVHAHFATHPALAAWIIYRFTGISYSITVHAHDIYVEKEMLGTKLKDAVFIVAISEFNRNYLIDLFGEWIRIKTQVIRCGVLPEDYSVHLESFSDSLQDGVFEILCIGSLQPYKGQKYLIEACAKLNKRGVPFRCRIIGGGELQSELSVQISVLGLDHVVQLLGPRPQEEIAQMLPQANCYVQPSIITPSGKMEGIPVSIMEAMICSVPVVATAISGIPELVQDQVTGLTVQPQDVDILVNAIEVIYKNVQNARRMAENGKELVMMQYNLHYNVQQLSLLMKSAVQA